MPPASYLQPKLSPEMAAAVEQGELDFALSSGRRWWTTGQAAKEIGRGEDYIRELVDNGRLEATLDSAFGNQKSAVITRRSLLYYLASTSNFVPNGYNSWLELLVDELTKPQLERVIARAKERLRRMP